MTLEDLEALPLAEVPSETLTQYVAMLVGENENLKQQMTTLLDRQDRVGLVWGMMMQVLTARAEDQNSVKSI